MKAFPGCGPSDPRWSSRINNMHWLSNANKTTLLKLWMTANRRIFWSLAPDSFWPIRGEYPKLLRYCLLRTYFHSNSARMVRAKMRTLLELRISDGAIFERLGRIPVHDISLITFVSPGTIFVSFYHFTRCAEKLLFSPSICRSTCIIMVCFLAYCRISFVPVPTYTHAVHLVFDSKFLYPTEWH